MAGKLRVYKKAIPVMADAEMTGLEEDPIPFRSFYCTPAEAEDTPQHKADEPVGTYIEE